jgi:hypothetical protein
MMFDSPDNVDSFGEDDMGTLILVNVDDAAVGSVSFADRVASLSTKSSHAIHRTASLYVFDGSANGIEMNSGRVLLSASRYPLDQDDDKTAVSFFLARKLVLHFILTSCILRLSLTEKSLRWRSTVRATPLFGMEPPEVTVGNVTTSQQLAGNVEGCRNALSRMLALSEQGLNCVPTPSAWTFVGRVLHSARRQARVRTPLSIDDAIDDGRTLEYVFVCYVKTASDVPINGASQNVNGELCAPMKNDLLSATKWMSRSELIAMFLDQQACEMQLDHKFKAVATKLLALDESISSKSLDYWTLPSSPQDHPPPNEIVSIVDDLSSPPTNILHGDDRCVKFGLNLFKLHLNTGI